ncbi:MAG: response regulator [Deltaproteobacteria bacterium]|nr:response regulator [Deltaproteobacteria bacterium]MBW1940655.1 response regulator [Deltaproteobacteria bacterium]
MVKKILIVDDEFFITRALFFMFKKEGYRCQMAHEGQGAIEQIMHDKPDLIFMDVDMPEKDGYETAREIRSNPEWKDIHIIMLTAKGQKTDKKKGLEAGANDYILKPFDPRMTLQKVKQTIG